MGTKESRIRREVFARDNYTCRYCDEPVYIIRKIVKLLDNSATVDHVLPSSKGGTFSKRNLVTCCNRCNNLLGDNLDTFIEKRKFIQKYIEGYKKEEIIEILVEEDILNEQIKKWEREQNKRDKVRLFKGKQHARL